MLMRCNERRADGKWYPHPTAVVYCVDYFAENYTEIDCYHSLPGEHLDILLLYLSARAVLESISLHYSDSSIVTLGCISCLAVSSIWLHP